MNSESNPRTIFALASKGFARAQGREGILDSGIYPTACDEGIFGAWTSREADRKRLKRHPPSILPGRFA
jgi:hypothetical protein